MDELPTSSRPFRPARTAAARRFSLSILILSLVSCSMVGSGCSHAGPTGAGPSPVLSATPVPTIRPTISPEPGSEKRGILRLPATPIGTWNPLLESDPFFQDWVPLAYEGLFRITRDQGVQPVLASRTSSLAGDPGAIRIHLADNVLFHDGTRLDAYDVEASFRLIRSRPDSPFFIRIRDIVQCTALDDRTLLVRAGRFMRLLPYAMTFPILPSELLESGEEGDPDNPWPGTGTYMVTRSDGEGSDGGGYGLVPTDRGGPGSAGPGPALRLVFLEDRAEAFRAFFDDRIDMLAMDAAETARMARLLSVRMALYPGNRYLFLLVNPSRDADPEGPSLAEGLRQAIQSLDPAALVDETRIRMSPLPFPPGSRWLAALRPTLRPPSRPTWPEGLDTIRILADPGSPVQQAFLPVLLQSLANAGIGAVSMAPPPDLPYLDALGSSGYDGAMVDLPVSPVPSVLWWLSSDDPNLPPDLAGFPDPVGRSSDPLLVGELADCLRQAPFPSGPDPFDSLPDRILSASGLVGIGFSEEGVLLGPRVRGSLVPGFDNPFEGMEGVRAWPGS